MFLIGTLLITFLLSLTVAANPVQLNKPLVSLPISRRVNVTSIHNLVRYDQQRAAFLKFKGTSKGLGARAVISSPVQNQAVSYVASVGVGSPATTYSLYVDAGSSNTWVGANSSNIYVETSTSTKTCNSVSVTYGSASFSGTEFIDQVTLASGLVIPKQSIGVASTSTGFNVGVDGYESEMK